MGDDYLIGYRLKTSNASMQYENLSISKAMVPCAGKPASSIRLKRYNQESLKSVIENNEEEFLQFVIQQPIHLKSDSRITSFTHNSQEILTLPTQCYAVEFNEEFATITLLK